MTDDVRSQTINVEFRVLARDRATAADAIYAALSSSEAVATLLGGYNANTHEPQRGCWTILNDPAETHEYDGPPHDFVSLSEAFANVCAICDATLQIEEDRTPAYGPSFLDSDEIARANSLDDLDLTAEERDGGGPDEEYDPTDLDRFDDGRWPEVH